MEPTGFDHLGPDHSGLSPRVALPSTRMSTEEVLKALSGTPKKQAKPIVRRQQSWVVNRMTLTAWLGRQRSTATVYARKVSGFF